MTKHKIELTVGCIDCGMKSGITIDGIPVNLVQAGSHFGKLFGEDFSGEYRLYEAEWDDE